jgi:hypothetical protein
MRIHSYENLSNLAKRDSPLKGPTSQHCYLGKFLHEFWLKQITSKPQHPFSGNTKDNCVKGQDWYLINKMFTAKSEEISFL